LEFLSSEPAFSKHGNPIVQTNHAHSSAGYKMAIEQRYTKNSNLHHYNLKSLLLGALITAVISGLFYAYIEHSHPNMVISFFSAVYMLALYRLSGNGEKSGLVKNLFVLFLDFILLPLSWITTSGSGGPMLYYSVIFIVISSLLATSRIGYFIPVFVVVEVSILWGFESRYANFMEMMSSGFDVLQNTQLHYIMAGGILWYILYLNRKNTEKIHDMLMNYSMIDDLTKLYNRRFLFNVLKSLHDESLRMPKKYILLMLDVDNLKKVNDIYGHHAGDEVLRGLGEIIRNSIRLYDIGARYGGDEFGIVLPDAEITDIETVIQRIDQAFGPQQQKYKAAQLGLSFGYSYNTKFSIEETIKEADSALYHNKNLKKHKITILDSTP